MYNLSSYKDLLSSELPARKSPPFSSHWHQNIFRCKLFICIFQNQTESKKIAAPPKTLF